MTVAVGVGNSPTLGPMSGERSTLIVSGGHAPGTTVSHPQQYSSAVKEGEKTTPSRGSDDTHSGGSFWGTVFNLLNAGSRVRGTVGGMRA